MSSWQAGPGPAGWPGSGATGRSGNEPAIRASIGSRSPRIRRTSRSPSASLASATTGRTGSPHRAGRPSTASRAQSPRLSASTSSGISAWLRRGASSSQVRGRCSRQLTGPLKLSEAAQTPTACWALSTWPRAGMKRRSTPTEWSPALGTTIGRST